MTAMPEAALAREAELPYAICAVVVNRAAGRLPAGASIHADLGAFLGQGMSQVGRLLNEFLRDG
jgi:purine nucleoside phosphorylase